MSTATQIVDDFVAALSRAYHSARLYPGQHPATRARLQALEASARAVAEIAEHDVEVVASEALVRIGPQRFKIQHPGAREFLERSLETGARTIVLRRAELAANAQALVTALVEGEVPAPTVHRERLEAPAASKAPAPSRPGDPPLDPALPGRLLAAWNLLREERRYPAREIEAIALDVVRQPGDGLVEAALLYSAHEPLETLACHALNMARLTYLAGRQHGWRGADLSALLTAALWCDVGMLEIPVSIWGSGRKLAASEFRQIRKHPLHGARLLLACGDAPLLAAVAAFDHHRRPGGRGYPQVGSAMDPSPAAALIQAADVYAALRTPRAFRGAVGEQEARRLLARLRDLRLDAEAVDLLLERALPQGTRVVSVESPVGV